MQGLSGDFFAIYHSAMFELLAEDALKYNARLGTLIAARWIRELKTTPSSAAEFKESLGAFFKDRFKFADSVELTFGSNGEAAVHVEGCAICHGNDLLKKRGRPAYCPICHMVRYAAYKSLNMKLELAEIDLPGPVGECRLRYKTGWMEAT